MLYDLFHFDGISVGKRRADRYGHLDHRCKSGTSGAGRGAKLPNLYCEVNENIKAYGVATHRHTPEIEEQLGYASGKKVVLNFTPHLVPMNRGILVTEYAKLTKEVSYEDVKAVYDKYYGGEKNLCVCFKKTYALKRNGWKEVIMSISGLRSIHGQIGLL